MLKANKKKTYGNTWWGSKWIEALERIDSNRLARGKSYANTGKVKNIKLDQSQLSAKVSGNWASYYNIKISLTKFSKQEISKIKEIINNNSSIALDLSMGNLPDNLFTILEEEKINLFPKRWRDISANCSCPDSANPCKHLAAVYYKIANEIDKDPFILFDLKGITKQELQQSAGFVENVEHKIIDNFLDKFVDADNLELIHKDINFEDFKFKFQKLDVGLLLALLQDNPSFYNHGNFKEFLHSLYKTVSNNIDELISSLNSNFQNDDNEYILYCRAYVYKKTTMQYNLFVSPTNDTLKSTKDKLDALINYEDKSTKKPLHIMKSELSRRDLKIPFIDPKTGCLKMDSLKGFEVSGYPILDYFLSLPLDIDSENTTETFKFFNIISSMALGLIKANMYIPEVVYEKDLLDPQAKTNFNNFSIRYLPFLYDSQIKEQLSKLEEIMPANICIWRNKFLKKEGVFDILSIFITHIINKIFYKQDLYTGNKILNAFLYNSQFSAIEYDEKNIGKSLENWLSKLYIAHKDIVPVIRLEVQSLEEDEKFSIFVDVMDKTKPLEKQLLFSELFIDNDNGNTKKETKNKRKKKQLSEPILLFGRNIDDIKTDVSKQLIIASEYMPQLRDIIDSKGNIIPLISLNEMGEILSKTLGIFNFLGIEIIIPKELKKLAYPQLILKAKTKKSATTQSFLSLGEMLSFSYQISLGDIKISVKEFTQLLKSSEGLVKFKDQYLLLKPDEVQNILQKIKDPIPILDSPMQCLFAAISGEIKGLKIDPDEKLSSILNDLIKIDEIEIPKNLNATLRGYQVRGFKWLYSNSNKRLGCCLADDMGLGKTIQVITLILKNKEEKKLKNPALVICPTTLVGNWYKECAKFAPSLNVEIYHGAERELQYKKSDIVISTYGILRRDLQEFKSKEWSYLIIDEAQNIKNPDTDQTKAVKSLNANNYIAMTGTPVENRLTELWNIFDFANKGYLGSITSFKKDFSSPIEKYKDIEAIEKLKKATSPFMIRRLKTDKSIISDLPDKITFEEYCYLSKEQAAIYENIVQNTLNTMQDLEGIERKGLIFKLITSLKQICNHPANYVKKGELKSELSGKAQKAFQIIENVLENKEKALIFTQYKEMGDILVEMLEKELNIEALFFHGSLSRKKRDEMVEGFQNDKHKKLMIVSLKAGGTGLNLTAASNVIHYDLWWNPAVENQATDRVYRIGQEKKVIVHRLITLGTFEEKIDEIIKSKMELADLTVSTGEKWITELSNQELKEIFSLSKS